MALQNKPKPPRIHFATLYASNKIRATIATLTTNLAIIVDSRLTKPTKGI
ncbi:hypothetical protein [Helicobacter zhangjianzhongii]|uniref:Uncharacterized protein n=1 Tax=Helicobacter zhangjianzhongii TaxID=2974574 RepID=A0ACC6FRB7_9HELI|nr:MULTISPECIES: hypothetical protein [unclassified Helicobacter]MDL0080030.1 hypothetical protein [Helicobacter sp. CPD2-1]MDL0081819.1 hypothetical protein [Helicobacter sp. XJK30-2]